MTDRIGDLRHRLPTTSQTFRSRDDASMRLLELAIAAAAIAAVVLLALAR